MAERSSDCPVSDQAVKEVRCYLHAVGVPTIVLLGVGKIGNSFDYKQRHSGEACLSDPKCLHFDPFDLSVEQFIRLSLFVVGDHACRASELGVGMQGGSS